MSLPHLSLPERDYRCYNALLDSTLAQDRRGFVAIRTYRFGSLIYFFRYRDGVYGVGPASVEGQVRDYFDHLVLGYAVRAGAL